MKLSDLEPCFLMAAEPSTHDASKAQGIIFLCPKCYVANAGRVGTHSVIVCFSGRGTPAECDGPRWVVRGAGFDDLTITPSIHTIGGCGWHGFVKNGDAT